MTRCFIRRWPVALIMLLLGAGLVGAPHLSAQEATPAVDVTPTALEEFCGPPLDGASPVAEPAATPIPETGDMDPTTLEFDVLYLDAVIAHHEAGVRLARIGVERAQREEVRTLAEEMVRLTTAELEQLRSWRATWYPDVPTLTEQQLYAGFDAQAAASPGRGGTPGLEEMNEDARAHSLEELCGAIEDFDLTFIDVMVHHLDGSILLAGVAQMTAVHEELKGFAATVAERQQAEVTQLLSWRDAWYGGTPPAEHGGI
jgi:uncharacterized protein (DUF305 family)